jgi:hypothetical protein
MPTATTKVTTMCSRFRTQTTLALLNRMLGDPSIWSKVRKAPDREVGKSGENRDQIIAHGEFQPAAAFHDREDRCNFGPAKGLPVWFQFFRPRATGRIEFSVRLLLNSSSGYSRNCVSFL